MNNPIRTAALTSMLVALAGCADSVTGPTPPAEHPIAVHANSMIDGVLDDIANRLGNADDARVAPLLAEIQSDLAAGRGDQAAPLMVSLSDVAGRGLDPAEQDMIALSIDDLGARWNISTVHTTKY